MVVILGCIYWLGRLSSRRGGDGIEEKMGEDRYFSPLQSSLYYRSSVRFK